MTFCPHCTAGYLGTSPDGELAFCDCETGKRAEQAYLALRNQWMQDYHATKGRMIPDDRPARNLHF
jgi:hypothetical protein